MVLLELLFKMPAILCIEVMCLIIPSKRLTERQENIISLIVHIFTGILFVFIFIGIILQFNEERLKLIGKFLIFVPLGIIALQSVLGIIFTIVINKKKS